MSKLYIPKEQLTAYERWELGALAGSRGLERQPEPEREREVVLARARAAAESEAANQAARETARAEGYVAGYSAGAEQVRGEGVRLKALADAYEASLAKLEESVAEEVLD